MQEKPRGNTWLRSIGAGFAGIVVAVVPSLATDALMRALGIFPAAGAGMGMPLFLLATVYRTVYAIAGSWVAARLAPGRPMRLAMMLGWIGLVVNLLGLIAGWNRPELGPHWYPVALTVLALPGAWVGGRLAVRESNEGV